MGPNGIECGIDHFVWLGPSIGQHYVAGPEASGEWEVEHVMECYGKGDYRFYRLKWKGFEYPGRGDGSAAHHWVAEPDMANAQIAARRF